MRLLYCVFIASLFIFVLCGGQTAPTTTTATTTMTKTSSTTHTPSNNNNTTSSSSLVTTTTTASTAKPWEGPTEASIPCRTDSPMTVCVKVPGQPCTVRTGFLKVEEVMLLQTEPDRKCAAPMSCMRDWRTERSGICVLDSINMPCLGNNAMGDCRTLNMAPNSYCVEGKCRRGPSFPGDHCWTSNDCTAGSECVDQRCVGLQEGQICTNTFRLCDQRFYCPNEAPGHAKCTKRVSLDQPCGRELSILNLLQGQFNGINECEVGLHCSDEGVCVSDEGVLAKLGESCLSNVVGLGFHRHCEAGLFCDPRSRLCRSWPSSLWAPCRDSGDCAEDMVCNCKVGGIQVCEFSGDEAESVYEFLLSATHEVHDCLVAHNCWRSTSAYPTGLFNGHSCAWLNCRKPMVAALHDKFCAKQSLPEHRGCVMEGWCDQLAAQMVETSVAPPPQTPAPEDLVEKLSPAAIAGIVLGSLAITLVVFFSGFVIGWLRQKYLNWGKRDSLASEIEFSPLKPNTVLVHESTVDL